MHTNTHIRKDSLKRSFGFTNYIFQTFQNFSNLQTTYNSFHVINSYIEIEAQYSGSLKKVNIMKKLVLSINQGMLNLSILGKL